MSLNTKVYIGGTITRKQFNELLELLESCEFLGLLKNKSKQGESWTCSINEAIKQASSQGDPLCVTCYGMEKPSAVLTAIAAMGLHYRLEVEDTRDLMFVWTYVDGQEASGSVLDGDPIVSEEAVRKAHESSKIPDIIKNMERLSMLPEAFVVLESAREQLAHEKNKKNTRSKAQK